MTFKTLTVVIPCFDEEATIIELLGRVATQDFKGVEIEILVIDDGSSDKTVELLEQNAHDHTPWERKHLILREKFDLHDADSTTRSIDRQEPLTVG